tara:strand:- start:106 stop:549 length:444 start_codon:yes stop_codon:yes gene_type:complete
MDNSEHIKHLLDSYKKFIKQDLIDRSGDVKKDFDIINNSNFIVVSHNGAMDPILNFGNKAALSLWELSWEDFIKTPSRKTAELDLREKRQEMLSIVARNGFFDNYEGVRVSASGKRFRIEKAVIWNILNDDGNKIGQAATFRDVTFL